ncbi:MAG: thioredoxin [Phycisphaerales bacterium]
MATQLNSQEFKNQVLETEGVALIDFWAEWCPPCRALTPTIDELASDKEGSALVAKVNVDEAKDVAAQFNVSSIPTVIVFKNGKEVERLVGLRQKDDYEQALANAGAG